nr:MAG TPA: Lines C-terminus [Crassvirales sp.]
MWFIIPHSLIFSGLERLYRASLFPYNITNIINILVIWLVFMNLI